MKARTALWAAAYLMVLSLVGNGLPSGAAAKNKFTAPEYQHHALMRTPPIPADRISDLLQRGYDIVRGLPDGSLEILATPAERDELITQFGAGVQTEDVETYYQSRLTGTTGMGGYHTYGTAVIEMTLASFDPLALLDTIGYTLDGNPIRALKISDNVEIDEDEPQIMFNSLIHAREPISLEVSLYVMHYLLDNYGVDPEVTELVNSTEIWLVPIINVDGYLYNEEIAPGGGGLWRKNMRDNGDGTFGVDLNRNWGFKWGYDNIGSGFYTILETYRGTAPFSEPETQVMRDFINGHDFSVIVNNHTYGNDYLRSFHFSRGEGELAIPDNWEYASILDSLFNMNGYGIVQDWYPSNGDANDWQYGEQFEKKKIFAIATEIGPDFWPPTEMIPQLCEENLEPSLFFIRQAHRLWRRPTRSLGTTCTHFSTTIDLCASPLQDGCTFHNVDDDTPFDVEVGVVEPDNYPGWLTVTPYSGTINPGESFEVSFEISPTAVAGLPDGEYVDFAGIMLTLTGPGDPPVIDSLLFPAMVTFEVTDMDADSVGDDCDNCPEIYNPGQEDLNNNEIGDACECYCPGFCDLDRDEAINPVDIVYLVNYVYKSLDAREQIAGCLGDNGDWDCSGAVNPVDVVWYVNFVYKSIGEGPCDPCACTPYPTNCP